MAIELVPLCTLRVQLKPPIAVGTGCAGTRVIFEVASVQVKGDRLRAEMTGAAAADWQLIGPEGTATLDVRATLRTDDGAIIFMQFNGKSPSDAAFRQLARGPSTRTSRSTTSGMSFASPP